MRSSGLDRVYKGPDALTRNVVNPDLDAPRRREAVRNHGLGIERVRAVLHERVDEGRQGLRGIDPGQDPGRVLDPVERAVGAGLERARGEPVAIFVRVRGTGPTRGCIRRPPRAAAAR